MYTISLMDQGKNNVEPESFTSLETAVDVAGILYMRWGYCVGIYKYKKKDLELLYVVAGEWVYTRDTCNSRNVRKI